MFPTWRYKSQEIKFFYYLFYYKAPSYHQIINKMGKS